MLSLYVGNKQCNIQYYKKITYSLTNLCFINDTRKCTPNLLVRNVENKELI